jgi:hypothetical protein
VIALGIDLDGTKHPLAPVEWHPSWINLGQQLLAQALLEEPRRLLRACPLARGTEISSVTGEMIRKHSRVPPCLGSWELQQTLLRCRSRSGAPGRAEAFGGGDAAEADPEGSAGPDVETNDESPVERGMFAYDALYRWYKPQTDLAEST